MARTHNTAVQTGDSKVHTIDLVDTSEKHCSLNDPCIPGFRWWRRPRCTEGRLGQINDLRILAPDQIRGNQHEPTT